MNHPSDDALNNAWNHLTAGNDPGASPGLDPADAVLLRVLHASAAGVAPDPAFRDQLWADLSRRPAISAPSPVATPSRPAPVDHRTGEIATTPRLAPTGRRWSPPIATIAAALVIVLVGYGALSLSGANPSGLNLSLNEVPNASAQGQGQALSDSPVVGTWGWLDDSLDPGASSLAMSMTITLDPGGGVTATAIGDWTGHGTWSASSDLVTVNFSVLVTQEALKRQAPDATYAPWDGQPRFVPNILVWTMAFGLSADGDYWEEVELELQYGVRTTSAMVGSGGPQFFVVSDFDLSSEGEETLPRFQRVDSILESAPTINARDAGLESAAPEASTPPALVTVTPIPRNLLPTPTVDLEAQATVYVQATTTAESALPTETPLAQLNPTEQVTVTPIATVAP